MHYSCCMLSSVKPGSLKVSALLALVALAGLSAMGAVPNATLIVYLPEGRTIRYTGALSRPETALFAVDLGLPAERIEVIANDQSIPIRSVAVDPLSGLLGVSLGAQAVPGEQTSWLATAANRVLWASPPGGPLAPVLLSSVRSLPAIGEILELQCDARLSPGLPLLDEQQRLAGLLLLPLEADRWLALTGAYLADLPAARGEGWMWPGDAPPSSWERFQAVRRSIYLDQPGVLEQLDQLKSAGLDRSWIDLLAALVLSNQGNDEEAVERLGQVMRDAPGRAEAAALAGAIFFRIESYRNALGLASASLLLRPNLADSQAVMGTSQLLMEDPEAALRHYREALRLSFAPSRRRYAWFGIGNALTALQRHGEALEAFGAASRVESLEESGSPYWKNLLGDPKTLQEGLLLAEAKSLALLGRWQEAVDRFQRALEARPALRTSQVLLSYGEAESRLGRWDRARQLFEEAGQRDPQSAAAFHWLGVAHSWSGSWKDAIEAFEKADSLQPDQGETLYLLGLAYLRASRPEEARRVHQRLVRADAQLAARLLQQIENSG